MREERCSRCWSWMQWGVLAVRGSAVPVPSLPCGCRARPFSRFRVFLLVGGGVSVGDGFWLVYVLVLLLRRGAERVTTVVLLLLLTA